MSHSLNEIEAMAKKAARGAGMSWGLCEEAGKAVRWLESHQLPGVASFVALCQETDGQPETNYMPESLGPTWRPSTEALGPIFSGATLNDDAERLRDGGELVLSNLMHPLLFVPFAAWSAIHLGQPVSVTWGNTVAVSDGFKLSLLDTQNGAFSGRCDQARVKCTANLPTTAKSPDTRGHIDTEAWQALTKFAHRTYAPATEESRLLGAGAGTNDND